MKQEVLIAGFGGQGILLIGQLLAEAAMREGLFATWFPSYGPEMRGGTANCTTIYSDEEIGSPIAARVDLAIVMNQPSLERFGRIVRPGGLLLVNQDMVPTTCDREDIRIAYIRAAQLAAGAGAERVSNVVMLGALLGVAPGIRISTVDEAIREVIGRKRPDLIEVNLRALRVGSEAVQSLIGVPAAAERRAPAGGILDHAEQEVLP
jgi:2-oxoglutarate ferredoxin oxidoreductase subunit gamma